MRYFNFELLMVFEKIEISGKVLRLALAAIHFASLTSLITHIRTSICRSIKR